MTEPIELADRRAERRRSSRVQSPTVLVTLPYTDGELAMALGQIEEVLLRVDLIGSEEDPLPQPLDDRRAVDAIGHLASHVGAFERYVQEHGALVQPLAPDGRFELVPLDFVILGREQLSAILGALRQLLATRTAGSHWALEDVLSEYTGDARSAEAFLDRVERVVTLLELPWDDHVDTLAARLSPPGGAQGEPVRITLDGEEHAAYLRLSERVLAAWHRGDPLERFIYRG